MGNRILRIVVKSTCVAKLNIKMMQDQYLEKQVPLDLAKF